VSRPPRTARNPGGASSSGAPDLSAVVVDDRHATLEAALLDAQRNGFVGPAPIGGQLEHAGALAQLIGPFSGRFLDLGTGAGIPGLVLAIAWPECEAVLLDAHKRRCRALDATVDALLLRPRVEVRAGRAEMLAREPALRSAFGLVVARAFGLPAVTAECAVGFLERGGRLIVSEPPPEQGSDHTSRWDRSGLRMLGLEGPTILHGEGANAAEFRLTTHVDDRWPRRDGMPAKRPLW
jgi:16S rRNA (guanine527-N7)-methyltransferase